MRDHLSMLYLTRIYKKYTCRSFYIYNIIINLNNKKICFSLFKFVNDHWFKYKQITYLFFWHILQSNWIISSTHGDPRQDGSHTRANTSKVLPSAKFPDISYDNPRDRSLCDVNSIAQVAIEHDHIIPVWVAWSVIIVRSLKQQIEALGWDRGSGIGLISRSANCIRAEANCVCWLKRMPTK